MARSHAPGFGAIEVVVETPKGSRHKYKFDEELGLFRAYKLLPLGAAFPFDFGFIPGTRAQDGDALDVMVLGEEPTFTGCLVNVRLLGVIEAEQIDRGETIRNDRLIGATETPKIRPTERALNDVPVKVLDQIEHFFAAYNRFEGREFKVLGRRGPAVAVKRVEQAVREYQSTRKQAAGRRTPKAATKH